MPEGEWGKSGKQSFKGRVLSAIGDVQSAVREGDEARLNRCVAYLKRLVGEGLLEEDSEFGEEMEKAREALLERRGVSSEAGGVRSLGYRRLQRRVRPDFLFRLDEFGAIVGALKREGTLGKAEIPFESDGSLEEEALAGLGEGVEVEE